jgi:hypothetical protein
MLVGWERAEKRHFALSPSSSHINLVKDDPDDHGGSYTVTI